MRINMGNELMNKAKQEIDVAFLKEVEPYERDVFYYETDRMGIVHHSNYIRWLEEARNDFYAQTGFAFDKIEDSGIMVPVVSASCQYKIPFRFGDRFRIQVIPVLFNGVKFGFEYEIYDAATDELRAKGASEHCFSDFSLNPVRLNHKQPDMYQAFLPFFPNRKK